MGRTKENPAVVQKSQEQKKEDNRKANKGKQENPTEQAAIIRLNELTEVAADLKHARDKITYEDILDRKAQLEAEAGETPDATAAIARLQAALDAAKINIAAAEKRKEARRGLKDLTGRAGALKSAGHRKEYEEILEKKSQLEKEVGDSGTSMKVIQGLQDALDAANTKITASEERKKARKKARGEVEEETKSARGLKRAGDRDKYNEILAKKRDLETKVGKSRKSKTAIAGLQDALNAANTEITAAEKRRESKKQQSITVIKDNKGTPLEKLIKKNEDLGSSGGNAAAPSVTSYAGGAKKTVKEVAKQKFTGLGKSIKDAAKEAFSGWKKSLDTLYEVMTSAMGMTSNVSGLAGDSMDIQDMKEVMEGLKDHDKSGAGITSAAAGGVVALLKSLKFIIDMVKEGKKDFGGDSDMVRDHQERWKLARKYMHDLVDIVSGFLNAFGPLSKAVPFFNSIAGLCTGGVNMVVDVMDMISSSRHVHSMRKERNRIYQRIQDKKAKYAKGGRSEDKAAEEAYTVESGFFRRSSKVDKKRGQMMQKVQEMYAPQTPGTPASSEIHLVNESDLRSRNDSVYRNAQYGLGKRIKDQATNTPEGKSRKRQMEAFQMMEEFREVDKAHKKMSKALVHNIESILKGGASLVSYGMKLAGEISAGTGAGLGVYAGGLAVGLGVNAYEIGRDVGSAGYKGIRTMIGTEDNKATTREDMAIALIDKMDDVSTSAVWESNVGFKSEDDLKMLKDEQLKDLIVQGRNVQHLHNIFRSGLDATMTDLLGAKDRKELKEKIAESFGQDS